MSKAQNGVRLDPACATCRSRCRKCDRGRPSCRRCAKDGLQCGGYPPRFQFHQVVPREMKTRRLTSPGTPETMDTLTPPPSASPLASSASCEQPEQSEQSDMQIDCISTPSRGVPDFLFYFDKELCDHLAISLPDIPNPFRALVLPLAYERPCVLDALLGLTICHARQSLYDTSGANLTAMLEYKLSAIQSLSALLSKEEIQGLDSDEEDAVLATALLLILHDICESGMSAHGAHLNGVATFCGKFVTRHDAELSPVKSFMLTALSWLDLLRGTSGAEKLAYADEVRQVVLNKSDFSLELFVGCPVRIFRRIGKVLSTGKRYLAGTISRPEFETVLGDCERFLRAWSPDDEVYPTRDPEWRLISHAYRHACILRLMRFPDPFARPCEEERFKMSVAEILDVSAQIPRSSPFRKRLLFPTFMAGAETSSLHQQDYVRVQLNSIVAETGFGHHAMLRVLQATWTERKQGTQGWVNVPWQEYTCSTSMQRQHDYLFF